MWATRALSFRRCGRAKALICVEPAKERFRAHHLGEAVHGILWNEWDPIGVNGMFDRLVEIDHNTDEVIGPAPDEVRSEEWPDDEYDTYVWAVLRMLDDGADSGDIGAYLDRIVTQTIGLSPVDTEAMIAKHREIARRLVDLRVAS